MNNYILYMHITPNNKVYIGITCQGVKNRWGKDGKGYYGHRYFWNAIQKYGWDNIKHVILAQGLSKKWACRLEQLLIAEYMANNSEYGYNLSIGGEFNSGFHYKRTPEFIERIRELNTGKHHSEETRRKISENNKSRDPEVVEKIKQSLKKTQKERTAKRLQTMRERYPEGITQSAESNRKRSEALKGKPKSEETKQKMRKPKSPEAVEHMRQAQIEAWKRRKEQALTNLGG